MSLDFQRVAAHAAYMAFWLALLILFTRPAFPDTPSSGEGHASLRREDPGTLDAIGRAEMQAGHYRSAKRYFERSSQASPGEPIPIANLAQACFELGEYTRTEQLLNQVLIKIPDSADAWQLLGQVLFRSRQYATAESAFRKALSLTQDALIWSDLAALSVVQHREEEAVDRYLLALSNSSPGQGRARVRGNLARLQWKRGDREQAIVGFRRAIDEMVAAVGSNHPEVAILLDRYSEVLRGSGRKRDARIAGERALEIRQLFHGQIKRGDIVVDLRELR